MTISQTKTFNIFVGPIQRSSATKILASNYKCENFDYIPNRDLIILIDFILKFQILRIKFFWLLIAEILIFLVHQNTGQVVRTLESSFVILIKEKRWILKQIFNLKNFV